MCDVSLVDIFGCDGLPAINRQVVDEHAKLKTKLKTKLSSQPRNPSPTCVSQVKWGQVSLIPDESHQRIPQRMVRGIPQGPRDPTKTKDIIGADLRSPEFRK